MSSGERRVIRQGVVFFVEDITGEETGRESEHVVLGVGITEDYNNNIYKLLHVIFRLSKKGKATIITCTLHHIYIIYI